jgi:hypothetical protein
MSDNPSTHARPRESVTDSLMLFSNLFLPIITLFVANSWLSPCYVGSLWIDSKARWTRRFNCIDNGIPEMHFNILIYLTET